MSEVTLKPSVTNRTTWHDNLFLDDYRAIEVKTEPSCDVGYKQERIELGLNTKLADLRYFDTKANHENNVLRKKINTNEYNRTTYNTGAFINYEATEKLEIRANAGWGQDYSVDTYWDKELTEYFLLKRNNYNASTGFSYDLTELDSVSIDIAYAALKYSKRIVNFSDYNMFNVRASWQHTMFNGTVALISQANWQRVDFDSPPVEQYLFDVLLNRTKQDITQDAFRGLFGFYWAPFDNLNIQAMAGVDYSTSVVDEKKYSAINVVSDSSKNYYSTGFTGNIDLTWKSDTYRIWAGVKQDFLPSTFGELRKTTTIGISLNYNITEKSNLYSATHYVISKSDNVTGKEIDKEFWRAIVQYGYSLTDEFNIKVGYTYLYYNDKAYDDSSNSNSIYLQFAYKIPLQF